MTVRLTDAKVVRDVLKHPKVGIGEAYMDGRLEMVEGDLLNLLDLVTSNTPWETGGKSRKAIGRGSRKVLSGLMSLNGRIRSLRNVAHHYDLSDRLYDLFLDSDRQYSCAYFFNPTDTLEALRLQRRHILQRSSCLNRDRRCWILDAAGEAWRSTCTGLPMWTCWGSHSLRNSLRWRGDAPPQAVP